jgi:ribonuclease E
MKKEMLINVLQPEECRIAIVEDGILEELYVERASQESYVNNIYKGRIVNIEPSIQAAFVDFGIGRNGFLHVSDVDPVYYRHIIEAKKKEMEDRRGGRTGRDHGRRPFEPVVIPNTVDVVPPEFQDEPPIEIIDEVHSSMDFDEPTKLGDSDFGSGLDLGEPIREPERPKIEKKTRPTRKKIEYNEFEDDRSDSAFGAGLGFVDEEPIPETSAQVDDESTLDEESSREMFPEVIDEPIFDSEESGISERNWIPEPLTEKELTPEPLAEIVADLATDNSSESTIETPVVEEVTEAPTKKRGRPSRKKASTETSEEPTPEAKPKKRRTRKKEAESTSEEGESPSTSEENGDSSEDKDPPKYMPSAERRTTGDEPEIENNPDPDGGFVFDPFAPNDRFTDSHSGSETPPPNDSMGIVRDENHLDTDTVLDENIEDNEEISPLTEDSELELDESDDLEDLELDEDDLYQRRDRGDRRGGRGGDRRGGRGGDRRGGRGGDRGGRGGDRRGFGRDGRDAIPKPPIQEIFKRGQEVIVQVIKEGIGTKGPTLSTYISIAGRYLVLMPSLNRLAVSRKIMDEDTRGRLKENLSQLTPPKGIGFIIRTAAIDRNKEELQKDLAYLVRLWEVFCRRVKKLPSPVEIYRESDMITRTIRDNFTSDIDTIWVDEERSFTQAQEFLNIVMPRYASRIKHYADTEPLFHRFRIEDEIHKIQEKKVPLPMGGSIVIEQTEALVAIDVNSGNFRADNNAEETAYQMNLQAAREIGRQLRLRDLGGVIVNDFIDMKDERHRRGVENALRDALRRDRARTKILRTSAFGVIEMTRQRIRPSLKRSTYMECTHCRGSGSVKTAETLSIEIIRVIQLASCRQYIRNMELKVHPDVAHYLLNKKRRELMQWEEAGRMNVIVTGNPGVSPECMEFQCFDSNGNEVRLMGNEPSITRGYQESRTPGRERYEERDSGRDREDRGDRDRGDRGDRGRDRGRGRGRRDGGRGRDRDRD